jgi:hypothetical protein
MSGWDWARLWRWAVVLTSAAVFVASLTQTAFVTECCYVVGKTLGHSGFDILLIGSGGVLEGYFQPLLFGSIIAGWICACAKRHVATALWAFVAIGLIAIFRVDGLLTPGDAAWIANPIMVTTWFLYLADKRRAALISAGLAAGLTLAFLSMAGVPMSDKLTPVDIISYGTGYWLWITSAGVLLAGVVVDVFLCRATTSDHP